MAVQKIEQAKIEAGPSFRSLQLQSVPEAKQSVKLSHAEVLDLLKEKGDLRYRLDHPGHIVQGLTGLGVLAIAGSIGYIGLSFVFSAKSLDDNLGIAGIVLIAGAAITTAPWGVRALVNRYHRGPELGRIRGSLKRHRMQQSLKHG